MVARLPRSLRPALGVAGRTGSGAAVAVGPAASGDAAVPARPVRRRGRDHGIHRGSGAPSAGAARADRAHHDVQCRQQGRRGAACHPGVRFARRHDRDARGVSLARSNGHRPPPGWSLHSEGELCLYTVDSVLSWQPRSQDDIWRLHGKLSAARARVVVDGGVLDIGMLHLKSARDAIDDFFDLSTIPTLGPVVDSIERIRNIEAGLAEEYFDGAPKGPMVVGGDFNLPPESRIFRRYFSGWSDAFARAGLGTGYSWHSRWHGLRIDHVLTRGGASAIRAWIGPDLGSDHMPLMADAPLPAQRTNNARYPVRSWSA